MITKIQVIQTTVKLNLTKIIKYHNFKYLKELKH